MEDRADPMLTYAMTVLAANKQARLAGQRATFGRVSVEPNGTNAVPSKVTGVAGRPLLDRRGAGGAGGGGRRGRRPSGPPATGRRWSVTAESVSGSVAFDPALAAAVAADHEGGDWPIIPTQAGHDAGILSAAGIPTAMLFVRNPTGISHSPARARLDRRLPGRRLRARRHPGEADPVSLVVPPGAGLGRRRRARRRAGRDRGRAVHRDRRHLASEVERFPRSTGETVRLAGLTLPGLANCHSHAFHRALRGRTQRERGTFWTWREQMYGVAGRLDPDSYFALARATYREMAAAGITTVGEFHYLHHQPDGTPYDEPNAMGHALVAAARRGRDPDRAARHLLPQQRVRAAARGRQVRYTDGDADALGRAGRARIEHDASIGAAIHSVRAVPRDQLPTVVEAAQGRPLHVHLSEQVAENDACLATYGVTPTQLLHDAGALGPRTTRRARHPPHRRRHHPPRHARHAAPASARPPSATSATASAPAAPSQRAGATITLGSDSHAVIDLFEEMRAARAGRAARHPAARPLDRRRAARGRHRPRVARVRRRRRDRRRPAGRPGHHRHHRAADRRDRRRRAHRRLRRHRRRRHPRGRRRPRRRDPRRPRGASAASSRPRSGGSAP